MFSFSSRSMQLKTIPFSTLPLFLASLPHYGVAVSVSTVGHPGTQLVNVLDTNCGHTAARSLMRTESDLTLVSTREEWLERENPDEPRHPQRMKVCEKTFLMHVTAPNRSVKPVDPKRVRWAFFTGPKEVNKTNNFENRIIPIATTWLKDAPDSTLFAVFSDTPSSRAVVEKSNCTQRDKSAYECRTAGATVTAIFTPCPVDCAHSSNCWTGGVCCKFDAMVDYFTKHHHSKDADWFYIGDDDVYFETSNVLSMLSIFDASQPYVVNGDGSALLHKTGLHKWSEKVHNCNPDMPQGFFYGMYSRGVLRKARKLKVVQLCRQVNCAHDLVAGMWAWTVGAKFIPTREQSMTTFKAHKKEKKMFYHNVKFKRDFDLLHARGWQAWNDVAYLWPDSSVAQIPGREYKGRQDPCDKFIH
eukprot:TRINITY_DN34122_c0_g1_i1.p1 TRINITY_DN34122_c0_g1~~TRINITY_DN34122_c0_g1_i1.p1  ORF type:complete len:415 (-),score=33.34 TRINITY_DN34122_c0_g1_i1:260-1504(-)